jgi:predicted Zn-dependent protease
MMHRILATILLSAAPVLAADDPVVRAMRDELARSMKKLQLENLGKPYFVAYRVLDSSYCIVSATFGALIGSGSCEPPSSTSLGRSVTVEVRVGDYARDNTNFFTPMVNAGVARPLGGGGVQMPIDDSYDEIRRQLWLATDSAYKTALDSYAKKKAALEHRTRQDDAPDFSHEPVVNLEENDPPAAWTRQEAEATVKSLSAVFRQMPGIDSSGVRLNGQRWVARYVNSEGTSYVRRGTFVSLQVNADTQAVDGMPLADYDVMYATSMAGLPPRDEMVKRIRALASRIDSLRKAPLLERYTGPVLFEGQAAGELFFQALGGALTGVPRIVVDDARFEGVYNNNGGLLTKIGTRVLPEFLSLKDAPASRDFNGQPLFGGYQVDDDGVKAGETELVNKGILKTLLHTRALIPNTTHSTASRRGPLTSPSNLLFTADKPLTAEQLKAELIRTVKQRNLEFGVVVRRMSNPQLAVNLARSRVIVFSSSSGPGSLQVEPLSEAYKVFPDGHEEPLRNVTITGLTIGDFRNILAVSAPSTVYTAPVRIISRVPFSAVGFVQPAGPQLVSATVPSMLFEDMSLDRPTGDIPRLPFSTHPYFDK